MGEDFLYLCTKNFSPFKGLQLQQGIAPSGFYTLSSAARSVLWKTNRPTFHRGHFYVTL